MAGTPEGAAEWLRLARYQQAHPQVAICRAEGWWHAWVPEPGGDRYSGTEVVLASLDDLLARLGEIGGSDAAQP